MVGINDELLCIEHRRTNAAKDIVVYALQQHLYCLLIKINNMSGASQQPGKFIVMLEGHDMQLGTQFSNNKPWHFNLRLECTSLKEAFGILQQFENACYDQKLVRDNNLPRLIQSAAIFDKEYSLLLTKRFARLTDSPSPAGGIYIELDSKKLSPQQLQEQTGFVLPVKEYTGPLMDFHLIVPATELRQNFQKGDTPTTQRRHSQHNKDVGPDKGKGISR